ncbi:MAG: Fe-S cluster assembly ATPase SufC [Actinobacteria bacterium]|nr:Fe-S cluster assembly ATPase SufC [Actinomycetota bacterium]
MSVLEIKNLQVQVSTDDGPKDILRGVDLTVRSGETHALMGPNGSGKSTLAYAIAGHPKYDIVGGTVTLDGADVLEMSVDERARAGMFLAMQYPVEVPGVSMSNFLRTAVTAVRGEAPNLRNWIKEVKSAMGDLQIDEVFAERSVNEGFSGGERKRAEILQLELLQPKLAILDETDSGLSGGERKRAEILQLELLQPKIAILDETDSGLDVDALRVVSAGINRVIETGNTGVLLITHFTRILSYVKPDFVHVFFEGRIVRQGGPELAAEIEENGYAQYVTA